MRFAFCLLGLVFAGCLAPRAASERAIDAARELNLAARFGRMDVALGLTAQSVRDSFLEHRATWGRNVRVLDVELGSFSMPNSDHAAVEVDYSWSRANESQLRTTRVAQDWRDNGGGFKLVRERRIAGDLGLFGEVGAMPMAATARDTQFATKVIP